MHLCAYLSNMGRKKKAEDEKVSKPGVSLDQECRAILSKILEWELAVANNDLSSSQAIRKCMRIAWQKHYERVFEKYEAEINLDLALINDQTGNVPPQNSKVVIPSESYDGGSLTPPTKTSRQNGKRK